MQVGAGDYRFGWRADVGHDDRAEGGVGQVAEDVGVLGGGEGDDGVSAEGTFGGLGDGIGVPAGGQIYRDHGDSKAGEKVSERSGGTAQGRTKPGAYDCVEKEFGGVDPFAGAGQNGLIGNRQDGDAGHCGVKLGEGFGCLAFEVGFFTEQDDFDGAACDGEMACGHKAITSVIAFAA